MSVRLPPRHRRVRRARCSALNTVTMTSSSSVRSSSLRSRAVVVAASHTLRKIGAAREQAAPVFGAECSRSFTFAPGELGFGLLELAQALLPLALEAARDEAVLGIDSAIAAFGTLCLVPGTLGGELPLGE